MTTFYSLDEAREFFKDDKFATKNGVVLDEIDKDSCTCSLEITNNHRNAYGAIMGGVIFTLADFSFAVLSNQLHRPTVGQEVTIHYLSSSKGNKLFAHATCRKDGRTTSVINVDITDELGKDIAWFVGTGFKL
ncbi:MAG: hypothetical protein BZ135_02605 [Methanosphaera sp. rholeuAM6]|nr:MAG: hypothetical protein BZ135_02605 [Methanosphaera sp. rholeuAM6]